MQNIHVIFRRELLSYFSTPIAYVFIIIFLLLTGILTFQIGNFFENEQANLRAFFQFHPWLYLFLVPAISMRLWSEERKSGTLELLLTLPINMWEAVVGKYLAAWVFTGIALALTFPIWITVNYLGDPDNGVILAGYIGSFLTAGGMLAIGSCISAITKNQVIAFIVTLIVCFAFVFAGHPVMLFFVSSWAPEIMVDSIASLSFLTHYEGLSKGVLDLRDVLYFFSVAAVCLYANAVVIDLKKAM